MNRLFAALLLCSFMLTSCAQKSDYVVTIKTSYGDMVAILYNETPKHKKNFVKLAKEHYFDSLLFHRVIQGFMIQGGDPDSKKAQPGQHLGMGGPGYTIDAEFNPKYFHEKGALSAARLGDQQNPTKASSGSQFYIVQGTTYSEDELKTDQHKLNQALQQYCQNPANKSDYDSIVKFYQSNNMKGYQSYLISLKPKVEKETGISLNKDIAPERLKAYTTIGGAHHLDDQYTVFGKVIKGLEVIDRIAAVPKGAGDRPREDIRMIVTVEEMSKKKIEKLYGYTYPEAQ
ncbi:MAG: peptidylprolyl isomerase [Cyclobacteriaceae bacterium]|nr:peptidylprolyl isomerase [Cyclobacteriaceae bacterium]